jgi:hypothetical protein
MTNLTPNANWQTKQRGTNEDEFDIFLHCADDGKGGDITRGGAPLPTFEEWLAR